MELRLHALSNMSFVEKHDPPIETGASCKELTHESCSFPYKDRQDGCYNQTKATRERRLKIDFTWWGDHMSRFAFLAPLSAVEKDSAPFQGKAFSEFLCFPKDYGHIGAAMCAKLANDFASQKDAARQFATDQVAPNWNLTDAEKSGAKRDRLFKFSGGNWFETYEKLEKMFQLGSNGGIVMVDRNAAKATVQAEPDGGLGTIEVEVLGPKVALVLDPHLANGVFKNDIVLLSHNPGEGSGIPNVTDIVLRPKPETCEVNFDTRAQRNRMLALAAVLGCEVQHIDEPIEEGFRRGSIMIAHDGTFDIPAIAHAADISFPSFDEWDESQFEDHPPELEEMAKELSASLDLSSIHPEEK